MSRECTSCGSLLSQGSRSCQVCIDEREERDAELALLRELEALCSRLDARYDDGLRQHMGSRTADTMLDVLAKLDALRSR